MIDAKVSLNEYQDAFGAIDETAREAHLMAHANAIRAHVNTLGAKAYWTQFEDAPDYVVMFIPGEHFLTAALEQDPTFGTMPSTRNSSGNAHQPHCYCSNGRCGVAPRAARKEARQIGELGKELYDRLAKAADDLRRVGSGLATAVNNYNSFVSSFEVDLL